MFGGNRGGAERVGEGIYVNNTRKNEIRLASASIIGEDLSSDCVFFSEGRLSGLAIAASMPPSPTSTCLFEGRLLEGVRGSAELEARGLSGGGGGGGGGSGGLSGIAGALLWLSRGRTWAPDAL